MRILITESQLRHIIEQTEAQYEFFSLEKEIVSNVFLSILNKEKIEFHKINPNQYKQALTEFTKYREFYRFPVRYIYKWKNFVLYDIALLEALTSINGHTTYFPFDEFYDIFDYSETYETSQYNLFTNKLSKHTPDGLFTKWIKKRYEETGDKNYLKKNNFSSAIEFLEDEMNMDDYIPFFTNDQPVLSDFGLEPLLKLADKLVDQTKPEDIIVTINKILDISHMRSDLSEIFIYGGQKSLDFISNN